MVSLSDIYTETAEIIDIKYDEYDVEPEVLLKVNGLILYCYDPIHNKNFIKGKVMNIYFSLLSTASPSNENIKLIQVTDNKKYRSNVDYNVCGELVAINNITYKFKDEINNYSTGIIDCGIFIDVALPKGYKLNIGDYVTASGRLDVHALFK